MIIEIYLFFRIQYEHFYKNKETIFFPSSRRSISFFFTKVHQNKQTTQTLEWPNSCIYKNNKQFQPVSPTMDNNECWSQQASITTDIPFYHFPFHRTERKMAAAFPGADAACVMRIANEILAQKRYE